MICSLTVTYKMECRRWKGTNVQGTGAFVLEGPAAALVFVTTVFFPASLSLAAVGFETDAGGKP